MVLITNLRRDLLKRKDVLVVPITDLHRDLLKRKDALVVPVTDRLVHVRSMEQTRLHAVPIHPVKLLIKKTVPTFVALPRIESSKVLKRKDLPRRKDLLRRKDVLVDPVTDHQVPVKSMARTGLHALQIPTAE